MVVKSSELQVKYTTAFNVSTCMKVLQDALFSVIYYEGDVCNLLITVYVIRFR
jgi:hypothetical protein